MIRHTYYFNGWRRFQGPRLRGGPTLVQVIHPETQCLLTIPVTLPAGAPVVEYRKDAIRYLFPDVTVKLEFKRCGRYEVEYHRPSGRYEAYRRKIAGRRSRIPPTPTPTVSAIANGLSIGLGGPANLASRLPVLSDLLESSRKRIPGTLVPP
ncbi:MAG: hypothetical protein GXP27_16560 [Planctomycetes bacterium]|nr:hypothetical protein [Planctomycetota bacterium]